MKRQSDVLELTRWAEVREALQALEADPASMDDVKGLAEELEERIAKHCCNGLVGATGGG